MRAISRSASGKVKVRSNRPSSADSCSDGGICARMSPSLVHSSVTAPVAASRRNAIASGSTAWRAKGLPSAPSSVITSTHCGSSGCVVSGGSRNT